MQFMQLDIDTLLIYTIYIKIYMYNYMCVYEYDKQ